MTRVIIIDSIEYEVLPLDNLTSPLCGTSCGALNAAISIEEAEHEERVLHAKKARAAVKRPFGKTPTALVSR